MNPVEVEKGVAAYLRALQSLPAGVQVHEAVTSEDLDLEKQAVVVECGDADHRGIGVFLVNLNVSVRSPALVATQDEHMALFDAIVTALQAQQAFETAFDAEAENLAFRGSYITSVPGPTFQERAWVNSVQVALGVQAV